jgi:hypothetical protein
VPDPDTVAQPRPVAVRLRCRRSGRTGSVPNTHAHTVARAVAEPVPHRHRGPIRTVPNSVAGAESGAQPKRLPHAGSVRRRRAVPDADPDRDADSGAERIAAGRMRRERTQRTAALSDADTAADTRTVAESVSDRQPERDRFPLPELDVTASLLRSQDRDRGGVNGGRSPWGISSAGRALAWHARGQEFESPILHQSEKPAKSRAFLSLRTRVCKLPEKYLAPAPSLALQSRSGSGTRGRFWKQWMRPFRTALISTIL